jgi:hypothetical protein
MTTFSAAGPRESSLDRIHRYEYLAHFSNSMGDGGLPYISTPTRKIFAAIHVIPNVHR